MSTPEGELTFFSQLLAWRKCLGDLREHAHAVLDMCTIRPPEAVYLESLYMAEDGTVWRVFRDQWQLHCRSSKDPFASYTITVRQAEGWKPPNEDFFKELRFPNGEVLQLTKHSHDCFVEEWCWHIRPAGCRRGSDTVYLKRSLSAINYSMRIFLNLLDWRQDVEAWITDKGNHQDRTAQQSYRHDWERLLQAFIPDYVRTNLVNDFFPADALAADLDRLHGAHQLRQPLTIKVRPKSS